ncbi:protein gp37 [Humidesulfovibrio mexicanus]|uniref:Protein gp37 n=1 Tax=Humidesulfovibrio mexicanus TaxID=147047 RepID=A0A239AVH4_9BACT|nr:DUF5131 family protein [Humidesulfovibrio mexicanus]SNR99570.1 protein gp37 [Humidesulfovibrio mexicanus]
MATTKIEFAHETLNPLVGCSRVSPGCDNCYAVRMAHRFGNNPTVPQYKGLATMTPNGPAWTGEVRYVSGVLEKAQARLLKARSPRRIFMVSMGDLFHPRVMSLDQGGVFVFMRDLPRHHFIIITKRPATMAEFCRAYWPKPLHNVMLMATCEDQQRADERVPHLLKLAAQGWHTGVIVEPMLGPVNLKTIVVDAAEGEQSDWIDALRGIRGTGDVVHSDAGRLSWVVCGHEQGPGKREVPIQYPGSLASQCARVGVPFFFKKDSAGEFPEGMPRQFPAWMEA